MVGGFLKWPTRGHREALSVLERGARGSECRGSGSGGLYGISS